MNTPALAAGIGAAAAFVAHGLVGHRWFTRQLRPSALQATRLWGDAEVAWRVLAISWHLVSAVFLASAVTLVLFAFGGLESRELVRFIAAVHGAFLTIGLVVLRTRLESLARPFPALVVACLAVVSVSPWLA